MKRRNWMAGAAALAGSSLLGTLQAAVAGADKLRASPRLPVLCLGHAAR